MTASSQTNKQSGDAPRHGAPASRVLIVGLDGATWDVLGPLIQDGRMPRLAAAVQAGCASVLHSTNPPITPAAWTTFLTGKQPGSHGIIDFERYDVHTNKLSLNSTRCLDHVRNLWQILSDAGLKVGSVNVPMTYPAVAVNGFMVSGFETPGADSDFVFPPDLKEKILSRWPDPTLRTNWKRKTFGGDALFARNIEYMCRSFHQGADMSRWLGDRFGWDVLMVVLKLVDNLQHKAWKHLDPRWSVRDTTRHEIARRGFEELDRAVGNLLDYADSKDATVMMVSDHGHGSLEGKIQPNLLLQQWGYLSLHGGGAQEVTRSRYVLDRILGRTRRFQRVGDIAHDLAVDFSKTRACVMHAGMAGFLYINLTGRQAGGIVPQSEYESLRNELCYRLLGSECRVRDPKGNMTRLFSEVHKPEELYGCSREEQPWIPDLILTPNRSLAVVRKIRGTKAVRWLSYGKIEGTHRPEGIMLTTGPGVKRGLGTTSVEGATLNANIADCAPTILTLLGLPVPTDMQGRVVTELFDSPPVIKHEDPAPIAPRSDADGNTAESADIYTEEQLQQVTERLADLGYLE